ncbi:transcription elongation factor GreA [bacterium]|nr:transcription elongation factor GreA [FCB group bacterium]MBL7191029.1 transcription elongation factor GreA [bacterium]
METVYLTRSGLAKVEAELREYEKVKRPQMAKKLDEARRQGDLSENAEYDAAKEELARIHNHIHKLHETLSKVQIIDIDKIDTDSVSILNRVVLKDLDRETELVYTLVSPPEMDVEKGKISLKSPVGKALLGKRVGDIAECRVPAGMKRLKVLSILPPEEDS